MKKLPISALFLFLTSAASASTYTLSEDERTIPTMYKEIGIGNEVPYKILYAVALTESGYMSPYNNQFRPWPWTLNFNGKPERHKNKQQALESLESGLEKGLKNIDIGIAQINFKYNGELFPSIKDSIDPEVSLAVSAEILRRELKSCFIQDWWCAVGRYHSPGKSTEQKERALQYTSRVRGFWEQLL